MLLYPGLHALWVHRFANVLPERGQIWLSRLCSQLSRLLRGVDIHPASDIGRRVFIDHAIGVIIGETGEIGDDVLIYHGVTLGSKNITEGKRHPSVHDGVTLGANATLLGPITIGKDVTIGAGAVVVDDVSVGATVAGIPAERVDS